MTRDECWMSFSEALEAYLVARASLRTVGAGGANYQAFQENMKVAAEHMDALTAPIGLWSPHDWDNR